MRRRIGDIYRARLSGGEYAFMQHSANDSTQLNSNVVFVMSEKYQATQEVKQIEACEGFFAHVFLKAGETLNIWERVGWREPAIVEIPVTWAKCRDEDLRLEVSDNWRVWRTNEKMRAPLNQDELTRAELGIVINPTQIVERMERSAYSFKYPRKGQIGLQW
jgi:hypothetical protein